MLEGLRTTIYHTADLAAAKAWYTELAGHAPYFDEPFYVGFNVGGYELGLIPDGETEATTYWGTANLAAEMTRVAALGASVIVNAKEVGGGIKVAVIADAFGNRIGLIENPHFKLS
jgi:predicted enzyme related to lactoylglutathione lyase